MTARGTVARHRLDVTEGERLLGTKVENGRSESEANSRLARPGPTESRASGPE